MRLEIYAYLKSPSFDDDEYQRIQDQVEAQEELIETFILHHPFFAAFNKPLAEFSISECGLLYNEPVISAFIKSHPVQKYLPYNYWDEHAKDKISWRHIYETLDINRQELRRSPQRILSNPNLMELYDRSGFISPDNRPEALRRLLEQESVDEHTLKIVQFFRHIPADYWFFFNSVNHSLTR